MSIELDTETNPKGLRVKTQEAMTSNQEGADQLYLNGEVVPLAEELGVLKLRIVAEVNRGNEDVTNMVRYFSSFDVVPDIYGKGRPALRPPEDSTRPEMTNPNGMIKIGQDQVRHDEFFLAVDYMLRNTSVRREEDPRLEFLDDISQTLED